MSDVIEPAPQAASGSGPAWDQMQTLLVRGETVRAVGLQHRLYALNHRRDLAAATSGRFIYMRRPLLGGYQPFSIRWQDLREARLSVGMLSATLVLAYSANLSDTAGGEGGTRTLYASGLAIPGAQALYRECQAEEQAWREKRRVRSMEEMRAQSGGVQVATGVYPTAGADPSGPEGRIISAASADGPAERLAKAKSLLAQGLITDSEYEAIKARIVGAL